MNYLLVVSLVLLTGCASYKHTRTETTETTEMHAFLVKGAFNKLRVQTKDTNYSRTISIGSAEGSTEVEKLNELVKLIVEGAVQGAVKGAK